MGKLTDKVALITGSDSGIGHATAVEFAREGADVIVNYLQDEQVPTGLAPKSRARAARRSSYKPITATRTKSKSCSPPPSGNSATGATEDAREELGRKIAFGPRPRVGDHERREALGMADGDGESDRTAPVLHHHRHARELEAQDELLEDVGVFCTGELVARRRRG